MIDSHCHLDSYQYGDTQEALIAEAVAAGVDLMITIGADLPSSQRAAALARRFPEVRATVGIHPHDASTCDAQALAQIEQLAAAENVVAIGEIGLDYYRDLSPRAAQKIAFQQQLELAARLRMPVVIHTRESFADTLAIVRAYAPELVGGVFHCFPGTPDEAEQVFSLGNWYISVGGVITYKNSQMALTAAVVPLERVLLETDAPYLTPVPFRGQLNKPAYVSLVAQSLAAIRNGDRDEIISATDATCRALFRLSERFEG